jgi:cytochrome c oxidase subunit 3
MVHSAAFTIAARETELWLGTLNTAILLTSSLTVALAVKAERTDLRLCQRMLLATVLLGLAFMGVKALEYWRDIENGLVPGRGFLLAPIETQIFWALYWLMTGVHAVHVLIGIGILTTLRALKRMARLAEGSSALEVGALYWHLVDVIWIFLYPILYLVGRAS